MKNLFELSEEEKNQIRGLHESYKSKPGTSLNEQRGDLTGVPGREDTYKVNIPKWKNLFGWKNTGKLNFSTVDVLNNEPSAIVKLDDDNTYNLRYFTFLPGYSGPITPETPGRESLEEFNIPGDSLPFADNMVTPDFNKFPEAKKQFDIVVNKIADYINAGGFDKLNNMTIQGSADSANPTLSVPAGYTQLDHNPPYDGETDLNQMNLFLAKKRAENYAAKLIESVKNLTEKTLTIKLENPISYLGKGDSYRGPQFRSIKLTPNVPKLTVPEPKPKPISPPSRDPYAPKQLPDAKQVKITVTINRKSEVMDGYSYPNDDNTNSVGVEKIGSIPNKFEGMVDGTIENNILSVTSEGVTNTIGKIENGKPNVNSKTFNYTVDKYSGPLTTTYGTKNVKVNGKEIMVNSIKDIYITFEKIKKI